MVWPNKKSKLSGSHVQASEFPIQLSENVESLASCRLRQIIRLKSIQYNYATCANDDDTDLTTRSLENLKQQWYYNQCQRAPHKTNPHHQKHHYREPTLNPPASTPQHNTIAFKSITSTTSTSSSQHHHQHHDRDSTRLQAKLSWTTCINHQQHDYCTTTSLRQHEATRWHGAIATACNLRASQSSSLARLQTIQIKVW